MIQLNSELDERRQEIKKKNEEILEIRASFSKINIENQNLSSKVGSLLNDKQLLEQEIRGMHNEFETICVQLDQLQDKDIVVKTLKEEVHHLNSTLTEKSKEIGSLQNTIHTLKLDIERIQRN